MRETGSTWTHPIRLALTWGALFLLSFSGCGINNSKSTNGVTTDCILNADQGATLTGRWIKTSVPIAFQSGSWNPTEIQTMIAAADTWNNFFAASMGYPAIDYGTAANPRMSSVAYPTNTDDFCRNQAAINNDFTYSGVIVIYKDATWPYSNQSDVIALTTTCRNTASNRKLPFFSNSFMEINYQNFFVNGNRIPDLQSIVLHEMGHLMGINHSCEHSSTTTGMPNCDSGSVSSLYLQASMYPTFSFYSNKTGKPRRSLNDNDEGRMNCVYKYL